MEYDRDWWEKRAALEHCETFRVGVQAGRELPLDLGSKKSLLWGSIDGWVFFKRRKNGGAGGGSKVSHESRIGVDY